MSNDLLFSIIPRANNRVPVKDRGQIKRIDAVIPSESLNEEERALHNEQRKVTEKEQYREHNQAKGQHQDENTSDQTNEEESDVKADSYDESGRKQKKGKASVTQRKHIDKYV